MTHSRTRSPFALVALLALMAASLVVIAAPVHATETFEFTRLFGADRYGTARAIAEDTFPAGADTVLLAQGTDFPDALAASYLAGNERAPVLLTDPNFVPEPTETALENLKTKNVIILGGSRAVSQSVEDDLENTASTSAEGGNLVVTRIFGNDRYATAAAIAATPPASAIGELNGRRTAIVASGERFPDALAGGPLSYDGAFPTLLTGRDFLPDPTADALEELAIETVLLLGGTAAVSQEVQNEITSIGIGVTRIAGEDRTDTAARIARFAVDQLGFDTTHVNLARGDAFPDALAGGPHGGDEAAPILLSASRDALGEATRTYLSFRRSELEDGHIFGSTGAVSASVERDAEAAAGSTAGEFDVQPTTHETLIASSADTSNEGARACSAVLSEDARRVNIALFSAALVDRSSGTKFTDSDGDGHADLEVDDEGAVIEQVNGNPNPDDPDENRVVGVSAVDGGVTFVIDATSADDVVAVVWQDADADAELDVDGSGRATEPFGAGCPTAWIPPESPDGSRSAVVDFANIEEDYFVATTSSILGSSTYTYFYDSGDEYQFHGSPITFDRFEGVVSALDEITITYDSTGNSTYNITKDVVEAPTNVVASALKITGQQADDIRVEWIEPPQNGAATSYRILQAPVDDIGPDGICNTPDDNGPESTDFNDVALAEHSPYDHLDQEGCFVYRVESINSGTGATAISPYSNTVGAPGSDDVTPPIAVDTRWVPGVVSRLEPSAQFQICFNEVMADPTEASDESAGDVLRIADGDGTVGEFENGVNARFYRGDQNIPADGGSPPPIQCPGFSDDDRARIIHVVITGPHEPVAPGSSPRLERPATIIDSIGVTDPTGNEFDIAGSEDLVIDEF